MRGQWGEIYPEVLDEIAKHIPSYDDYVRLRAVNKSWNKALPKIPRHIRGGPRLVLAFDDETFPTEKEESYHLRLPQLKNTRLRGSCLGWLIYVGIDGDVCMFNPFTNSSFHLPPLSTFPNVISYQPHEHDQEYTVVDCVRRDGEEVVITTTNSKIYMQNMYISKIIISSSPEEGDNFMAVAMFSYYPELAFYRSGDDKWTSFPFINIPSSRWRLRCRSRDVIFHKGKIYAVNWQCHLYEFDMKTLNGGISEVPPPPSPSPSNHCLVFSKINYLVKDPDDHLLMVVRHVKFYGAIVEEKVTRSCYRTARFDIFELDESVREWRRKFSLGNYVLILGYNSSICRPPFVDEKGNCARNCIYYTEQFCEGLGCGDDIGVFNLQDESIRQLLSHSGLLRPAPVWLLD